MKKIMILVAIITTTVITAQTQSKPYVDVWGEGTINVVPDQVTVKVRVENTGENAKEVKLKNDRIVSDVLEFVKGIGIAEKYIRTEYIRLSKNYEYQTKTYNYQANQSISIKLIDLSEYETLMNGLLATGINRIDGISFSSSEIEMFLSEARKKAVDNAKLKAQEYASVLGQSIGKALYISEFQKTISPNFTPRNAIAMDSDNAQQTMAPGEMKVSARVNISFELN
jgi:uncharacterized protein YggE